jgi:hypothetical protein
MFFWGWSGWFSWRSPSILNLILASTYYVCELNFKRKSLFQRLMKNVFRAVVIFDPWPCGGESYFPEYNDESYLMVSQPSIGVLPFVAELLGMTSAL